MCIIHDKTCDEIVAIQEKTQLCGDHTLGNNFIPLAIKIYGCLHLCFDSFFISCVWVTIAHHLRSSLITTMFISYY